MDYRVGLLRGGSRAEMVVLDLHDSHDFFERAIVVNLETFDQGPMPLPVVGGCPFAVG
jgi:hypothetical protein